MFESHISIIVELCIIFILSLLILLYFARKKMNIIIFITSLICWFMNLFLIILIPYDIYYTQSNNKQIPEKSKNIIEIGYKVTYWILFILSWFIIPIMKSYETSGAFSILEKLKISLKSNIKFYIILGIICLFGIIYCLIAYGHNMTFLLVKNFSLIFGIIFFFFLLSYGLIKYPKTLYSKYNFNYQIKYLEWKADNFINKLSDVTDNLIINYSKLKATKEFYDKDKNKNKINNNNSSSDDIKDIIIERYIPEINKKFIEFELNAEEYGINTTIEIFEEKEPVNDYNELIELNKKINSQKAYSLILQSRLRNCYMRWARLNTVKYLSKNDEDNNNNNYNKIDDENNINTSNNEDKKEEKEKTLEEEGFIPLENFSKFKLLYYSAIKKYFYFVFLILSIIAGIITIFWEFFIICGFRFIKIYKNIENIIAIHLITLIPLIYLISISNYTLFKIKLSSYLFMYGPRQTDSVSLITFSSYLSRIYFAICLNYIQAINQFSEYQYKTKFESFFGLDNYNFILYLCRYSPILLFIFIILFYFNIPGKIGNCFGYNLFEFESKERNQGIENGHKYLMKLNKKLNGKKLEYNDNKIFDGI